MVRHAGVGHCHSAHGSAEVPPWACQTGRMPPGDDQTVYPHAVLTAGEGGAGGGGFDLIRFEGTDLSRGHFEGTSFVAEDASGAVIEQ